MTDYFLTLPWFTSYSRLVSSRFSKLTEYREIEKQTIKKNIAAKKAPNARFVQGGAPGLVQQARVGRAGGGGTRPPGTGIKKEIKDGCKLFKVDLVIMQIGAYYKLIEEDANYMHEEFGLNYTNTGEDIDVVGFPRHDLKNKKRQLLQKDICFCIVDEVAPSNGRFIIYLK